MAKKKSSAKAKPSKKAPAKKKPAPKKAVANKKIAPKKKAVPAKKKVKAKKAAPAKKSLTAKKAVAKKVVVKKKAPSKSAKKVAPKKVVAKKVAVKKAKPVKKAAKAIAKVVKKVAKVAKVVAKVTKKATTPAQTKPASHKPKAISEEKNVEQQPKPMVDNSIGKNYTPPITAKPGYMPNPTNSKPTLPPPPTERKATPEDDRYISIKKGVLNTCIEMQTNIVNTARKAMDEAQESANEEKGSTEEKFDSFRESMQIARDMHARQVAEGIDGLGLLKRIAIVPLVDHVKLGAIVYTTLQNYFISASLGEIDHEGKNYMAISTMTPLYQSLAGKQKGDKFTFRDAEYKITNVF